VGYYVDSKGVAHGFLLHQGWYTTIDHPEASTECGQGDIVGWYVDNNASGSSLMI
jgi:hypothetical protein